MGKTFKRVWRRNRFLNQRRERMPSIRAVETTFDEVNRQTLSPVRRSRTPSALREESQNDDYHYDHDYDNYESSNRNVHAFVDDDSDDID